MPFSSEPPVAQEFNERTEDGINGLHMHHPMGVKRPLAQGNSGEKTCHSSAMLVERQDARSNDRKL